MAATLYPRYAALRLKEALADSPVVPIHGLRQCGKTTLARTVGGSLRIWDVVIDKISVLLSLRREFASLMRSKTAM